jgi:hypothetical protein
MEIDGSGARITLFEGKEMAKKPRYTKGWPQLEKLG